MLIIYYKNPDGEIFRTQADTTNIGKQKLEKMAEEYNANPKNGGVTAYIADAAEGTLEAYLYDLAQSKYGLAEDTLREALQYVDNARDFLQGLKIYDERPKKVPGQPGCGWIEAGNGQTPQDGQLVIAVSKYGTRTPQIYQYRKADAGFPQDAFIDVSTFWMMEECEQGAEWEPGWLLMDKVEAWKPLDLPQKDDERIRAGIEKALGGDE